MPLYEYECQQCGKILETIQKFSDAPLSECSECGGALERLLSAPAIQFKGSGWYITDYAREGGSKAKDSSSSSAETTVETKSESKESTSKPSKGD